MTKEQKTLKKLNNQGYALVLVIIIVALVVTLAGSMIFALNTEIRLNQSAEEKERANYLAQAGIEHGLALLEEDEDTQAPPDIIGELGSEGNKVYRYSITELAKATSSQNGKITSVGQILDENDNIKLSVTIKAIIDNNGVVSLDVS